jgi:photosystem II stability/assembly factor-like uncharacterized protein
LVAPANRTPCLERIPEAVAKPRPMHATSLFIHALWATLPRLTQKPLWALVAVALLSTAPKAWANGRPPGTTGLVVAPHDKPVGDSATMMLGVTFGLAVSHDSGKQFHWVCEEAIGGPTGVDALLAAPSAHVLLTGSTRGLFISNDGGCNWQATDVFAPPNQVSALVVHPTDVNTWWVGLNRPDANQGVVYVTHNGGRNYKPLPFNKPGVFVYSLAVAASAPDHLVIAGSNNGAHDSCLVYRSTNGGKTWSGGAIAGAPAASATPVVAIHPKDKNKVLLGALDITTNGSEILLSEDGGQKFKVATHVNEPIRNIAFADHGKQIFVAGTSHIYTSRDGGHLFSPLAKPNTNACLAVDGSITYACGSSADGRDGFALAKSLDDGTTWAPMMALEDIKPPSQCPADSTVQRLCGALWTNQATVIKASKSADPDAEFIASEQSPSAAGTDAPLSAPAAPAVAKPAVQSGCHCALGGDSSQAPWAMVVALIVAHQSWRRFKRIPSTKLRR